MANFEEFRWVISSSINLSFLKSVITVLRSSCFFFFKRIYKQCYYVYIIHRYFIQKHGKIVLRSFLMTSFPHYWWTQRIDSVTKKKIVLMIDQIWEKIEPRSPDDRDLIGNDRRSRSLIRLWVWFFFQKIIINCLLHQNKIPNDLPVTRARTRWSWSPIISDQITIMRWTWLIFSWIWRSWSWVIMAHIFGEWS